MKIIIAAVFAVLLFQCITMAQQSKPLPTLKQAMEMDHKGKHADAVEAIKRIINEGPETKREHAYVDLGFVYFRDGDFDNALKGFSKAIELKKDNPLSYYFIGLIYEKKALSTSKPELIKEMKIKALEAWQEYLKYVTSPKIIPSEAHKYIGITVKEGIKRAKNHVEMLQEGLQ